MGYAPILRLARPIEMRFNELITGVRADLAIKLFGEDLDVLNRKAQEIKKAIENVEGAADVSVEKVAGLPQMFVKYNRAKIAKYGLNISDVNEMLTMGFAGLPAGSVFEGEKQFDLVVRYDNAYRKDIENIRNSYFNIPNGTQIPLSELAEINYTKGPAKISRDDTKRRIVVGVNVRNRDLESVVKDVQSIIESQVKIPVGYSVDYGGQFENLRNARNRLMVAVPIALLLIFVLLYFAFQSIKEALMVYSAIPLSAVGGILLLYFRGMPFSISAGVGFIALFGIAVLNGIVLIEHFKELKAHGMSDINERILAGTKDRLRPVLLTAAAAALGFIPMALSTSAGAEVQRPLATVVVGGLVSATLLTLIVLPVLYAIFDRKRNAVKMETPLSILLVFILSLVGMPNAAHAQGRTVTLEQAIELAWENNSALKASALEIERNQTLISTAKDMEKTNFFLGYDQNNVADNGKPLTIIGAQQSFKLPSVYKAQKKLNERKVHLSEQELKLVRQEVEKEISKTYYRILFWENMKSNYLYLDSLYGEFQRASTRRYETGETNYLEKLTAQTKKKEMTLQLEQCEDNIQSAYKTLSQWTQTTDEIKFKKERLKPLSIAEIDLNNHPAMSYFQSVTTLAEQNIEVEKKKQLPDFQAEYFLGSNTAQNAKIYNGFQVGVSVPLFKKAQQSTVNAAKIQREMSLQYQANAAASLSAKYQALQVELSKYKKALQFYETEGKTLAQEIINTSTKAFKYGEIDFLQYLQSLENAKNIDKNYLDNLIDYNLTVIEMKYLTY